MTLRAVDDAGGGGGGQGMRVPPLRPANTRYCTNAALMLAHRLRRCLNINSYSAGIDFSRQNLTSVDVRF